MNNKTENTPKPHAIIIFVDIRGFTDWSEAIEVFQHSTELVSDFYSTLTKTFQKKFYFKALGDGALLIKELTMLTPKTIQNELFFILKKIEKIEKSFKKLCEDFAKKRGHKTDLTLGWGITRGTINKFSTQDKTDYLGANINKAARLCHAARPFGIILEKDDFPDIPDKSPYDFFYQIRRFKGIETDVSIWVTKEIKLEFITREKLKETPEVHVAGLCIKKENDEIMLLIARRNSDRELFPDLYEGCGGQLAYSEDFIQGVTRHYRKEMQISVDIIKEAHDFYKIELPDQPLIPGIRFLCKYIEGNPTSPNHSELKWVTLSEFKKIPDSEFIPGLKEAFLKFVAQYDGLTKSQK